MTRRIVIWLLIAALAAAVIGGITWAYEQWRESVFQEGDAAGAARVQGLWDEDRARAQAATLEAAEAAAKETQRRLARQKENDDAQAAQLARVAADRDAARAAAGGLQLTAAAYLDAAGCGNSTGHSALECVRAATARALEVFGQCSNRVAELAAAVDDARTRGQRCEADYDALVLKPKTP